MTKNKLIIFVVFITNIFLFLHVEICLGKPQSSNDIVTSRIDSLENKLKTAKRDNKVEILNQLANLNLNISPEKSLKYVNEALELAKKYNNNNKEEAYSLRTIGYLFYYKEDFKTSLKYFKKSLIVYKKLDDKENIAGLMNNIGMIFTY